KDTYVLPLVHTGVEQAPQFGTLRLGVSLSEFVAEGEDALLGTRLFFLAPRPANAGIKTELLDGFEHRNGLDDITLVVLVTQHLAATTDRVFDLAHDQPLAELQRSRIAKCDDLVEVMAGVDMQQRKGKAARTKGFLGETQQHDGILSA